MDLSHIIGLMTGAAGAAAVLVAAISKALIARDRAEASRLRKELRKTRSQLAEIIASCGATAAESTLDLMRAALQAAGVSAVGGVVCADGTYTMTWGYEEELGHKRTAGLSWTDPRFVHPDDLEQSRKAAEHGFGAEGNRGEEIFLLTAGGVRRRGRVWSAAALQHGRRHRVFVVLLG